MYQYGSRGETVKGIQRTLIALGYNCGPPGADGIFGKYTRAAVKAYQKDQGIGVDGIVGPITWGKLLPNIESANKTVSNESHLGYGFREDPKGFTVQMHRNFSSKDFCLSFAKRVIAWGPSSTTYKGMNALRIAVELYAHWVISRYAFALSVAGGYDIRYDQYGQPVIYDTMIRQLALGWYDGAMDTNIVMIKNFGRMNSYGVITKKH